MRPTHIDLEDRAPPRSVALGQTLLRVIVGSLLVTHGVLRLLNLDVPGEAWVHHYERLDVDLLTRCVAGVEIAAGAGLVIGWLTRLCALVLVCRSAIALATHYQVFGMAVAPGEFELPLMLFGSAFLFCLSGGGPISLDVAIRERASRKAIEEDSLWLRPPYVGATAPELAVTSPVPVPAPTAVTPDPDKSESVSTS